MFKNVVGQVETRNRQNAFFITLTVTEKETISLFALMSRLLVSGKEKICMLSTVYWSIVRNRTFAEDKCSFNFWEKIFRQKTATVCVTIANVVCKYLKKIGLMKHFKL